MSHKILVWVFIHVSWTSGGTYLLVMVCVYQVKGIVDLKALPKDYIHVFIVTWQLEMSLRGLKTELTFNTSNEVEGTFSIISGLT